MVAVLICFKQTTDSLLQNFLVVADIRRAEPELSVIYRWNQRLRRFLRYQTLETHAAQDWEAFQIQNHSFLVVANHRRGEQEVGSVQMRPVSLIIVFCKLRAVLWTHSHLSPRDIRVLSVFLLQLDVRL